MQSVHKCYLHSSLSDENESKMHLYSHSTQAWPPEREAQEWTGPDWYCCKRIASSLVPTPSITCVSCDHISCDWRPGNKARLLPLPWLTSFPVAQCMVRMPNWYLESTRVCFQLGHSLQTSFTFSPSLKLRLRLIWTIPHYKSNMHVITVKSRFYHEIWLCITYVPWGSGTCNSLYLRRQAVWFAAQPTDAPHSDLPYDFSCRVGDF